MECCHCFEGLIFQIHPAIFVNRPSPAFPSKIPGKTLFTKRALFIIDPVFGAQSSDQLLFDRLPPFAQTIKPVHINRHSDSLHSCYSRHVSTSKKRTWKIDMGAGHHNGKQPSKRYDVGFAIIQNPVLFFLRIRFSSHDHVSPIRLFPHGNAVQAVIGQRFQKRRLLKYRMHRGGVDSPVETRQEDPKLVRRRPAQNQMATELGIRRVPQTNKESAAIEYGGFLPNRSFHNRIF